LADRHFLMRCVTITPENFSGKLFIEATLSARSSSSGVTAPRSLLRSPAASFVKPNDRRAAGTAGIANVARTMLPSQRQDFLKRLARWRPSGAREAGQVLRCWIGAAQRNNFRQQRTTVRDPASLARRLAVEWSLSCGRMMQFEHAY
jgi:hypothetical protein